VATVTENEPGLLEPTWTLAGTLQVGAKLGVGPTLQVRLTVPVNPPAEVADNAKLAFCPGVTDAEPDEVEASEKLAGCGACTVKACEALFDNPFEVPATVRL
jgi:hypothetical protein